MFKTFDLIHSMRNFVFETIYSILMLILSKKKCDVFSELKEHSETKIKILLTIFEIRNRVCRISKTGF